MGEFLLAFSGEASSRAPLSPQAVTWAPQAAPAWSAPTPGPAPAPALDPALAPTPQPVPWGYQAPTVNATAALAPAGQATPAPSRPGLRVGLAVGAIVALLAGASLLMLAFLQAASSAGSLSQMRFSRVEHACRSSFTPTAFDMRILSDTTMLLYTIDTETLVGKASLLPATGAMRIDGSSFFCEGQIVSGQMDLRCSGAQETGCRVVYRQ